MNSHLRYICYAGVSIGVFYATTASALDITKSTDAVRKTVSGTTANLACSSLSPFYWEIGNKNGTVIHGTGGTPKPGYKSAPDPYSGTDRTLNIASASKLVFGAYVVQRRAGNLSKEDLKYLEMTSGYPGIAADSAGYTFTGCGIFQTVGGCFNNKGHNNVHDSNLDGKFNYGGGHFQAFAALPEAQGGLNIGANFDAGLANQINSTLGAGTHFSYSNPGLAGGGQSTVTNYTQFLQAIVSGNLLLMKSFLGYKPVCTAGELCPHALSAGTPVRVPYNNQLVTLKWHYSVGHWVEDDPNSPLLNQFGAKVGDDNAYSSPGVFGFYPWIDHSKTYYGVVAREDWAKGAYINSALCGKLIRKAWFSGNPQ